ncbi:MAG: serine/threonine protein kinase [Propionibacteriaceae bacterium]|jgi:serine/threonine protein kinase|nr:serine/threonine protein kinase [Propionibacteriaceae bacterium]
MADYQDFLESYQSALSSQAQAWPAHWSQAYRIDECLQADDSKQVYLVTDRRTGVPVIVRATTGTAAPDAAAEAAVLAKLRHAGIPQVYGSQLEPGRSFVARQYFPGESLDKVVARGRLTEPQAVGVLRQLCGILIYLQSRTPPVMHRDLKPQNIIVRPDGTLGVTDFDIARTLRPGQASGTLFAGTRGYAPPEQYGYGQSTPATDVFASGMVIIFALTGRPDRAGLAAITGKRLRDTVAKCVEFDPAKRFPNAAAVLKALDGGGHARWLAPA